MTENAQSHSYVSSGSCPNSAINRSDTKLRKRRRRHNLPTVRLRATQKELTRRRLAAQRPLQEPRSRHAKLARVRLRKRREVAHVQVPLPRGRRRRDQRVVTLGLVEGNVALAADEVERRLGELGRLRAREGARVEDADGAHARVRSEVVGLEPAAGLACCGDARGVDGCVARVVGGGRPGVGLRPVDGVEHVLRGGLAGAAGRAGGEDHDAVGGDFAQDFVEPGAVGAAGTVAPDEDGEGETRWDLPR